MPDGYALLAFQVRVSEAYCAVGQHQSAIEHFAAASTAAHRIVDVAASECRAVVRALHGWADSQHASALADLTLRHKPSWFGEASIADDAAAAAPLTVDPPALACFGLALGPLRSAAALQVAQLGHSHVSLADTLQRMARALEASGELDAALECYSEMLELHDAALRGGIATQCVETERVILASEHAVTTAAAVTFASAVGLGCPPWIEWELGDNCPGASDPSRAPCEVACSSQILNFTPATCIV